MLVCSRSGYCPYRRGGMCYESTGMCYRSINSLRTEYTSWYTHEPSVSELVEMSQAKQHKHSAARTRYVYASCQNDNRASEKVKDNDSESQNENSGNALQRVKDVAQILALQLNQAQNGPVNKQKVSFCSLRSIGPCPCDGEHYSMGFCDSQHDCRYKHVMELTDAERANIIIAIKSIGR